MLGGAGSGSGANSGFDHGRYGSDSDGNHIYRLTGWEVVLGVVEVLS
jgi:hypothetical protein